jgi:hypothetical protein
MLQLASGVLSRASVGLNDPLLAPRRRRVALAILAIVIFSLADLYFTILFARSVGMAEANPVARLVMSLNSPALLGLWKCATVAGACLIFWAFRHRRTTEAAALACMCALGALTVWWSVYTKELPSHTASFHTLAATEANWVQFAD